MSKIRSLLEARKREVLSEMAPLKAELSEIERALAAISEGTPTSGGSQRKTSQNIGDQALAILHKHPKGLRTADVRKQIGQQFGRDIINRNMSWHLSRLKREGSLIQEGELWKIAPAKNETPDAGTSSVSEDGETSTSSSIESRKVEHDLIG